ncbi:MAG: biotin/lipoyl-binding protein [Ruminococcus sp.]|jgi:biotin carboxyl carrier protein|nr:biotin/lipoyl-binding protein [Ruminococcus sp.]MBQ1601168.1 biotin/lipoyl-binding protein [Ruminococcus sp.]MBQ1638365.1 biotin/lipoyl-binding protein [Ruminococcus sp.]MBQ1686414.1 biotin/lipoyl-binding protein [Ruminococcus sp.]MBQ1807760.1 biotin/lipoyl-binding protein [Ruminococcus sp.]
MKNFRITVNGTAYDVQVEEMGENAAPAAAAPAPVAASAPAPKKAAAPAGAVGNISVKAPMPGTVVNVVVTTGQSVKAGDDLVFIEAMKMETPVKAPQDATVATIEVSKGEAVDSGKVLVTLN